MRPELSERLFIDCLGLEYKTRNFRLYESGDHILVLEHDGEIIARFNATRISVASLRITCQVHLMEKHHE